MKTLIAIFATVVLLSLAPAGGNHYYRGKMLASANNAPNKVYPASPAPFSCVCSCGKHCDGSCEFTVEGCSLAEAAVCVRNCCRRAPNPSRDECGGPGPILP
jgi:hypothetical protein